MHEFRARNLSDREWAMVRRASDEARKHLGVTDVTPKELLMLLVNDTAPSWRGGRGRAG